MSLSRRGFLVLLTTMLVAVSDASAHERHSHAHQPSVLKQDGDIYAKADGRQGENQSKHDGAGHCVGTGCTGPATAPLGAGTLGPKDPRGRYLNSVDRQGASTNATGDPPVPRSFPS